MRLNKSTLLPHVLLAITSFSFIACKQAQKKTETEQIASGNVTPETIGQENKTTGVSFIDEKGETISLKSLKGKVVFINFWATWCPPCIQEMPSIDNLKKTFEGNDDIVFLMVDVDGNMNGAKAFMNKNKYDLPVYIPNGDIPADYLGSAIPTTVILAKDGEIVTRAEGGRDYMAAGVRKALNELVAE
ncbi:TlpA family protein disulfide reductase [Sphingobacterium sp. SGR-19]|uniref:TlpA family protein disulfide reductase n=1 Tax=Sphingobacterium sp. SGR-19 TaxID=2710886 RepID=UPI0013E9B07E|nr:TlpA disulfide reductase family protein [Sphingobacterium sp. SGR-19]NGM63907.1 TlpA family protein disulfide reductase [Sphingobacterium sp. SGR-19]